MKSISSNSANTNAELIKTAQQMLRYIDLMATNHMRSHYAFPESMKRWESSIEKAKDFGAGPGTGLPGNS